MSAQAPPRLTEGRWILSRYADVVAALRDRRLSALMLTEGTTGVPEDQAPVARQAALAVAGPARLPALEQRFRPLAAERAAVLPDRGEVDLVAAYGLPWCTDFAVTVTGGRKEEAPLLIVAARALFRWAGNPDDAALRRAADRSVGDIASALSDGLDVQTFVALAVTLPCFLAGAWNELYRRPEIWDHLRAHPESLPIVIDELLRLVGPSRAQMRRATVDVEIGGVPIPAGSRLVMRLDLANRDPEVFPDPDRISLEGRPTPHVAFGMGPHACAGMAVVRAAGVWATEPLLARFSKARWVDDPGSQGGWALGGDARVRVVVGEASAG